MSYCRSLVLWIAGFGFVIPGVGLSDEPTTSPREAKSERRKSTGASAAKDETGKPGKVTKSAVEWRKQLTPLQYNVARLKATERPFTGEYWNSDKDGVYRCVCCDEILFDSRAKFHSGTGWPSYWAPVSNDVVRGKQDVSNGTRRLEVICKRCDAHLGHVFPDGPRPTGLRYCINSASLKFDERDEK